MNNYRDGNENRLDDKPGEIIEPENLKCSTGGSYDPNDDDRRILNPYTPRKTAEIFYLENYTKLGIRSLQCVPSTEEFFHWEEGRYKSITDREIQAQISRFLDNSAQQKKDPETGEMKLACFNTEPSKENKVVDSLKSWCSEGISKDPSVAPSWIFHTPDDIKNQNPSHVVLFKNKLLLIDKFLKEGDAFSCLKSLTPCYFCCSQIPFDIDPYDHQRLLPVKFLAFLEEVFGGDQSSIEFLREWMGYCLTNQTWAQKILLIIGPKRSGKGTIAKVIQSMLGEENFLSPSAGSMLSSFGMEPWIGKRLAIFGDARFGEKIDKESVKELLLQISGEDCLTIPRKFKPAVSTRLPSKIMILSNEIPSIRDSGAALASRFIVLKMEKSFLGKEDTELFERDLKDEIPRIFWWALDGLRNLMAKKRFTQPESGKDTADTMESYQSPVKAFVDDMCAVKVGLVVPKNVLFNSYSSWCEEEGINKLSKEVFCRQIISVCHTVKVRRLGNDGSRVQAFEGICLKDRV